MRYLQLFFTFIFFVSVFTACTDESSIRREECLKTPCTDSLCLIWDNTIKRCGTPTALYNETKRLKGDNVESAAVFLLKRKLDKYQQYIDSIKAISSKSNEVIMASKLFEEEFLSKKQQLEEELQNKRDSLKILELKNGSPLTAIQWLEYQKHILSSKLDSAYLKKDDKKNKYKKADWNDF